MIYRVEHMQFHTRTTVAMRGSMAGIGEVTSECCNDNMFG